MLAMLKKARTFLRSVIKSPDKAIGELYGYFRFLIKGRMFPKLIHRPGVKINRLEIPGIPFLFNPSVTGHPDGWLFSFRVTQARENGISGFRDCGNKNEYSISYIVLYDENLLIMEKWPIDIPKRIVDKERLSEIAPNGTSDLRPFYCENRLFLLGYASNLVSHCDTMVLYEVKCGEIVDMRFIKSPKNSKVEKNWMPVNSTVNELIAIYTINPFVIISIENGIARIVSEKTLNTISEDYRGSSQVIPYRDGLIRVAHRVIQNMYKNIYLHRFFFYDNSWNLKATSDDFILEKAGVEFCAGLAIKDEMCLLTYGLDDKYARAMRFSCLILEQMLHPI